MDIAASSLMVQALCEVRHERGGLDALWVGKGLPWSAHTDGAGRPRGTSMKPGAQAAEEESLEAAWEVNDKLLQSEDTDLASLACGRMEGVRGFCVCKGIWRNGERV